MKRKTETPRTTYYLIYGRILGKRELYEDLTGKSWLYENGEWVPDDEFVIIDHLMGYDPSEPPDSPYAIGSTDVLDEIEEISKTEAMRIMEKEDSDGNRR